MEKEVPENILAKIRKLLRLKESAIKIGSEGEAHAAAEAVNRLLTSYNLSLMDVTPEEQKNMISVSESEKITYQDTYGNIWKRDLLRIICEYNFCRILLHGGTTYMVVVGTRENAEVVLSLYNYLRSVFRRLGLLLFLAEVGTSAGKNLVATFQESGLLMFGVGAAITLIPMLVAAIVGRLVFKISLLDLLGTITGGMTSTPGLAAADSMVDSNIPSVAYATVYPIAMVFLILFIQIIASAVY